MTKKYPIKGTFVAVSTPFNKNYQIELKLMKQHIDELFAQGANGALLIGTTGEASSISLQQKMQLIDYCNGLYHKNQLIFGVGTTSLLDTVELAKRCLDAGYCHLLVLPPFYYKNIGQEIIYKYYAKLIDKINDHNAKIFIYNIPQISNIKIKIETIEKLQQKYPQIIVGVKDSSGEFQKFTKPLLQNTELTVFSGNDTFLLDNLEAGGPGSMTALANIFANLSAKIIKTYEQQNLTKAKELQQILNKYHQFLGKYNTVGMIKYLLEKKNPGQGWNRVMLPLENLVNEQQKQIDDFVDQTEY